MSSAVTHAVTGHTVHVGVTITVSGFIGGVIITYVVSHLPSLHATIQVVSLVVCTPIGVNVYQPVDVGPVISEPLGAPHVL